MEWIEIEEMGVIAVERIVAVSSTDSAATRRLLAALPLHKVISLTGGRRRRSVVILDSEHAVITPYPVEHILYLLHKRQQE